jgi:hypothetical protein
MTPNDPFLIGSLESLPAFQSTYTAQPPHRNFRSHQKACLRSLNITPLDEGYSRNVHATKLDILRSIIFGMSSP